MYTLRSHYGKLPFSGKSKHDVLAGRQPDAERRERQVVGEGVGQGEEMGEMRKEKKRGGVCLACKEENTLAERRAE